MIFAAINSGSAKNNKLYGGAYVEHKKAGSVSNNHHNYNFKKSSNNWNGPHEVSSKAHRFRHVSKGAPMQLDPEPMFLMNDD